MEKYFVNNGNKKNLCLETFKQKENLKLKHKT